MIAPEIAAQTVAISALAQRFGTRRLSLFGSAATGDFDAARSDVDFRVDLSELPLAQYPDAYFGWHAALKALLGQPVDLAPEDRVCNPYLFKAISASRIPLYGA